MPRADQKFTSSSTALRPSSRLPLHATPIVTLGAAFLTMALASSAHAQAVATPRVGGMVFSGPAEPHVTSIYWNPAAIGPLRGFHAYVDFEPRIDTVQLQRSPIDTSTGEPADSSTPAAQRKTFAQQNTTDITPDFFTGLTWDLQSKRVVAGLAAYAPYVERRHGDVDAAGHYFVNDLDWVHLYQTTAAAFRIRDDLFFGLSLHLVWSWLGYGFDRDTALDQPSSAQPTFESDGNRENLAVNMNAGPDIAFSVGWLYRPSKRFDFGIVWIRPPLTEVTGQIRAEGEGVAAGPVHDDDAAEIGASDGTIDGRATATWRLPDQILLGINWRPWERWQFGLWGRWSNWSVHDALRIELSSQDFTDATPRVPSSVVFWRGFHDTFALQGTAAYRFNPVWRVFVSGLLETAAIAETSVNLSQVEGPKLDGVTAVEITLGKHVILHGGYGLTIMTDRELSSSDFDPQAAVACVDSGYDVDNPGCGLLAQGRALPTARGVYKRLVHHVGVGVTFRYGQKY